MSKINPFLWFSDNAEEAVNFYTSLFKNSKIGIATRYSEASAKASGRPAGSVMTISFQLEGYGFTAINGGPAFKINPSISFFFHSKDEKEIDKLWKELSIGGEVLMELQKYDWSKKYGWVQDKFGVSWQLMLAEEDAGQKIMPSLLFVGDVYGKAEEAMNFYTSVFENAKVESVYKYDSNNQSDNGNAVMYEDFTLEGNKFSAMDGKGEHKFKFNEAISFVVNCENQEEIDYYWNKLSAVPQAEMCGWLKDKFGVSWQIVPSKLSELLSSKDGDKGQRVMQKVLQMKKLNLVELENA
jgi:predicted 3-demethylubiquinone-9 3-methyltransferase (glyoxalase superfamily)